MLDVNPFIGAFVRDLSALRFGAPVTHVYNPLEYACAPHALYWKRYGQGMREIILVGMNPGPFGMAQTGVPFGDVTMVRDWLGIEDEVGAPPREHPKRPVQGFACPRGEVSGARLWGWARDRFGTPDSFFARFFVVNYCPLCFMTESGSNLTPDKLPMPERAPLLDICDRALRRIVESMQPRYVLGIGGFAEARVRAAVAGMSVTVGRIPHPSPASPAANRGWADAAEKALAEQGIMR
ncbi:MAG TPA: single-stranded DNA-binding protein [Candidatus Hydrogenedentes bacterium]|nr:single-stranded DNA-binding protein [Candidatus Hydrogenedentota bacterium]HOS03200.1 single-stranded DNA-binding protein [Candidatus Hydrogenedentota bacterium]